jgi:cell division protease FtsH
VVMPLPEIGERLAILRSHLADRRVETGVSVEDLARSTSGMSGADLANLVNEAALIALRQGQQAVTLDDLLAARDRVVLGIGRDAVVLSPDERRAVATHEAGHALVATLLTHADPVDRVTILPRGNTLGATMQRRDRDRHAMRREEVLDRICVALAGRAAELLVLETTTTSVADDLQQASRLARQMVLDWGMSDRYGPLSPTERMADAARALADEETARIIGTQSDRAETLLRTNRAALDRTIERLLTAETIDGETVRGIVQAAEAPVVTLP